MCGRAKKCIVPAEPGGAGQEESVVSCLFSRFEDYKVQLLLFVQRNGVSVWVCPSAHTLDLLPLFPLPVS